MYLTQLGKGRKKVELDESEHEMRGGGIVNGVLNITIDTHGERPRDDRVGDSSRVAPYSHLLVQPRLQETRFGDCSKGWRVCQTDQLTFYYSFNPF